MKIQEGAKTMTVISIRDILSSLAHLPHDRPFDVVVIQPQREQLLKDVVPFRHRLNTEACAD